MRVSSVDFSQYDPKVVRKFMYHLLERHKEPSSKPEPRGVNEAFKEGLKHVPSDLDQRVVGLEQRFGALEKRFDEFSSEITQSLAELQRQGDQIKEESHQVADIADHLHHLEREYERLVSKSKHNPHELKRVKDKIDTLKAKVKVKDASRQA